MSLCQAAGLLSVTLRNQTQPTEAKKMSPQPSQHHLDVPGGTVYYEVRGSGPLLLVIGQPMTSGPFGPLADLLAEDHTVVTYDPHGLGHSTVEDPALAITPEIEAEDLAHIVDAVGGGPADVFGSSGGAVAGLALAAEHPEKVTTLIAHEPPVAELLPDAPYVRTALDDVEDAYHAYGAGAAWGKFVSVVMHDGPVTEEGVAPAAWPPAGSDDEDGTAPASENAGDEAPPEPSEKEMADNEVFFLRMLKPFTRYQPPVKVLRSAGPRVVVAVGAASGGEIAARSARALAEQLGTPAAMFPGDHGGFMADPEGFAAKIQELLTESR
jgi:pimeloyl-ACP methyl ester carboxylesterase